MKTGEDTNLKKWREWVEPWLHGKIKEPMPYFTTVQTFCGFPLLDDEPDMLFIIPFNCVTMRHGPFCCMEWHFGEN